jgi:hypothetical protein
MTPTMTIAGTCATTSAKYVMTPVTTADAISKLKALLT